MQLKRPRSLLLMTLFVAASAATARADDAEFDIYNTIFYEFGGPLHTLNVNPRAAARANVVPELSVNASYDADIVSGASVAVVNAPGPDIDAITSATQYSDFRSVVSGGLEVRSPYGSLRGNYSYGWENDYRSHSFNIGARTELFERNTTFDLSYARGFDEVCNLAQPRAQNAVERRRLPNSEGCFSDDPERTALPVDLHTIQGSWTQAWAPIFSTQVTLTAQIVDGFQSSPYRGVWLGRTAAQEHHPDHRFRYAAGLGGRLWIAPLRGALQAFGRAYRDNWDVRSITAELAYEQTFDGGLRVRLRGRYYRQGGAAFFSNDYALAPRGQYFTGDRELSDMESFLVGAQLAWNVTRGTEGADLGELAQLRLLVKADWMRHDFPNFTYGRVPVPNVDAIIGTLGLDLIF